MSQFKLNHFIERAPGTLPSSGNTRRHAALSLCEDEPTSNKETSGLPITRHLSYIIFKWL